MSRLSQAQEPGPWKSTPAHPHPVPSSWKRDLLAKVLGIHDFVRCSKPHEVDVIVTHTVQMRKLRLTEVKSLLPGHQLGSS